MHNNRYKHANIVFPGLLEHPLWSTFQATDKWYIHPEGERIQVPIDGSFYNPTTDKIELIFAVPPDAVIRLRRLHLWIEPDSTYPRGYPFILNMFHGDTTFYSTAEARNIYSGMYYIIPFDVPIVELRATSFSVLHYADQQTYSSDIGYAEFSIQFKRYAGGSLNVLPFFYMIAEIV